MNDAKLTLSIQMLMKLPGPLFTFAPILLFAFTLPALALPTDANAVLQSCGQPSADTLGASPLTGTPQRDLRYNDLTLHFQPSEGGWSFTSAWTGHLPVTRGQLQTTMPCFRDAMLASAAAPQPAVDPTIAAQTSAPSPAPASFGIPFFWVIVLLGIAVLVVILWPSPRSRSVSRLQLIENRSYRKPRIFDVASRGHKPIDRDLLT